MPRPKQRKCWGCDKPIDTESEFHNVDCVRLWEHDKKRNVVPDETPATDAETNNLTRVYTIEITVSAPTQDAFDILCAYVDAGDLSGLVHHLEGENGRRPTE